MSELSETTPTRTGRPPSADWVAVLAQARNLVRSRPRPVRELFDSLVAVGVLEPTDTHFAGFRHQVREAQQRGDFPALPAAKRGPAKGVSWSDLRREAEYALSTPRGAHHLSPHELLTRREAACRRYLLDAVTERGRIDLTPARMQRLASDGWGGGVVGKAISELTSGGHAILGQANHTLILIAR